MITSGVWLERALVIRNPNPDLSGAGFIAVVSSMDLKQNFLALNSASTTSSWVILYGELNFSGP